MSVMQRSSATATATATAAPAVNIPNANNVYIAQNIINTNVHIGNNRSRTCDSEDEDIAECGSDPPEDHRYTPEDTSAKWTQTCGFICRGIRQNVLIAHNYAKVDLHISEKAAKILTSGNVDDFHSIGDAIGSKCLARLEWIGDTIHSNAMTAWKMSIKENMKNLCQDVITIALKEKKGRALRIAIEEAFQHGMKLMGIDCGSLVFIFQHVTTEGAELMCTSVADQKKVQRILEGLLPSWVKEQDISITWEVMQCDSSSTEDSDEWRFVETIPLIDSEAAKVHPSVDYRHMEQMIERTFDRYMPSIRHYITQTQEVTLQQLAKDQTEVLQGVIQTFMEQYTRRSAVEASPEPPDSPQTGSPSSLVTDEPSSVILHQQDLPSREPERSAGRFVSEGQGDLSGTLPEEQLPVQQVATAPAAPESAKRDVARTYPRQKSFGQISGTSESDAGSGVSQRGARLDKSESAPIPVRSEKYVSECNLFPIPENTPPSWPVDVKKVSEVASERKYVSLSARQTVHDSGSFSFEDVKEIEPARSSTPKEDSALGNNYGGKSRSTFPETQTAVAAFAPGPGMLGAPMDHPLSNKTARNTTQAEHESVYGSKGQKRLEVMETGAEGLETLPGSSEYDKDTTAKKLMLVPDIKEINRHRAQAAGKDKIPFSDREETDEDRKGKTEDDDSSSGAEGETADEQKKSQESKKIQAEQLLDWVNVKTRAAQSHDPEIQRLMDQVELALQDEEIESPKARALDTVMVLDTSDSVVNNHLDELKTVTHTFIDGIEDNVDTMNLEENLAVVQMGGRVWVRQHLTNDYNRVRDAVDTMTPDSKKMATGGRTAMFQALMVCLGALEGKGGVVSVARCHRVRPRLVFFTDGRPTDEASEFGADIQSNVNEVKFSLVQLISEFASKKHKTTPAPIFWVPIGTNADRPFMESLAALSGGKVVEKENVFELCKYYKVQETIGCVYKMVRKQKDDYETEHRTRTIVSALAGDLDEEEKNYILEEVRKKQKEAENDSEKADDFDQTFEDTELVNAGLQLPLGTRVRRGNDWKWSNQDTDGAGTVIQHRKKRDGWVYVMWDNGTSNAYRYGDGTHRDVQMTENDPRILTGSELIEIGVKVKRGQDWHSGDEDGNGTGIVIRKRKDGKVRVRWENGYIGKYKYGADGKMELEVIQECRPQKQEASARSPSPVHSEADSELGATGGYDPAEGPPRRVWQWRNQEQNEWRMYNADIQDKLLNAYNQRHDGSCVISREGRSRRVLFKMNQEKAVDKRGMTVFVQSLVVSELQYVRMLQEEEERDFGDNS